MRLADLESRETSVVTRAAREHGQPVALEVAGLPYHDAIRIHVQPRYRGPLARFALGNGRDDGKRT